MKVVMLGNDTKEEIEKRLQIVASAGNLSRADGTVTQVFGRYLSYCKLTGFRYFLFENSDEFQKLFLTPDEEKAYKQGYDQAVKDLEEKINNEKFHNAIKNIFEDILKDYKLVKK